MEVRAASAVRVAAVMVFIASLLSTVHGTDDQTR